jgi:hypothetical protein
MIDPITWFKRWLEWRRLLRMDDQLLHDIGCSRGLLRDGVRAWPWRRPEDSIEQLGRFRLGRASQTAQPASTGSAVGAASVDPAMRRAAPPRALDHPSDSLLVTDAIRSFLPLAWTR